MSKKQSIRAGDWLWIGALALVFAPAVMALSDVWLSYDYYSHGFLVPVVAYWMFEAERRRLPAPGADPRGLLAIAVAVIVYGAGLLFADATIQGVALVGAVAGVALRLFGRAGLRRLAFPLAFLLFMVPVPQALLTPLIVGLQLAVSTTSVELLHLVGFTVLREGNVVMLPGDQRLFVAEACSGITSVVTLLPLGTVLAYFTEKTRLRRALIVLAVVPFAMLGNLVRVLATVAAADAYGVEVATKGAVHDSAGVLTFALACLLLIGFGALVRLLMDSVPAEARRPA